MLVETQFFAGLDDLLPPERQGRPVAVEVAAGTTVKDLVESLGVPHTEIEVILVNGESVDFAHKVSEGARVSVYPAFEQVHATGVLRLRPAPPRPPRFVLDVHLGRLARHLRLLGFDTAWSNDCTDDQLVERSMSEHRIVLTRDRGLLMRRAVTSGYLVRGTSARAQTLEVLRRFDLFDSVTAFTRCLMLTDAFGDHVDVADGEHGDCPRPNDRSPCVAASTGAVRPGTGCRDVAIVAGWRVRHAGVKTLRSHLGGDEHHSVRCSLRS